MGSRLAVVVELSNKTERSSRRLIPPQETPTARRPMPKVWLACPLDPSTRCPVDVCPAVGRRGSVEIKSAKGYAAPVS